MIVLQAFLSILHAEVIPAVPSSAPGVSVYLTTSDVLMLANAILTGLNVTVSVRRRKEGKS